MATIKQYIITPIFKLYFEATLPAKRIVCFRCNGEGTHVNPSIDGDGLTSEDMSDLDFMRSYIRGNYDVTCEECKGNKVLDVLDYDRLSPKLQAAVDRGEEEKAMVEMESASERRMGA